MSNAIEPQLGTIVSPVNIPLQNFQGNLPAFSVPITHCYASFNATKDVLNIALKVYSHLNLIKEYKLSSRAGKIFLNNKKFEQLQLTTRQQIAIEVGEIDGNRVIVNFTSPQTRPEIRISSSYQLV